MQTKNTALIDLLGIEGARYVIPSYQRAYTGKSVNARSFGSI